MLIVSDRLRTPSSHRRSNLPFLAQDWWADTRPGRSKRDQIAMLSKELIRAFCALASMESSLFSFQMQILAGFLTPRA